MKIHKLSMLLCSTFILSVASANEYVERAQNYFIQGHWTKMAEEIKHGLVTSDRPEVKENLINLLEKSYQVRDGKRVPVNWSLPEEIKYMKISVRRTDFTARNKIRYDLQVSGDTTKLGVVSKLKVTAYPNTVVLEKDGAQTFWEDKNYGGYPGFYSSSSKGSTPVNEGLYLIEIELKNGKRTNGWFVLSNMATSNSVIVNKPSANHVYNLNKPIFSWDDFYSEFHKPFMQRRLSMWVGHFNSDNEPLWQYRQRYPSTVEAKYGKNDEGNIIAPLSPNKYYFAVQYQERKKFGDLHLAVVSKTVVPFEVK